MEAAIGAAVGGALALIGALLTTALGNRHQLSLQRLQSEEAARQYSRGTAEAALQHMARALHSVEWIGWYAWAGEPVEDSVADQYHREVHETFPDMISTLATLAPHDAVFYNGLNLLASEVFRLDADVAKSLVRRHSEPQAAHEELLGAYHEALRLTNELGERFAAIVRASASVGSATRP